MKDIGVFINIVFVLIKQRKTKFEQNINVEMSKTEKNGVVLLFIPPILHVHVHVLRNIDYYSDDEDFKFDHIIKSDYTVW